MKRLLFVALLALVACTEADAARMGRRKKIPTGGAASASNVFDQYAWDLLIEGRNAPGYDGGVQGYPISISGGDGGELAWGYGSDAGVYTPNVATTGLLADGIGASRVDKAVTLVEAGQNCWRNATSAVPAFADNADMWCRALFALGDNTTTRYYLSYGSSSSSTWHIQLSSTERGLTAYRSGASTQTSVTAVLSSAGAYHFVDYFYHGANPTNPSIDVYADGTATINAEDANDQAGFAAGLGIAFGGVAYQACAIPSVAPDITLVAVGCFFGAGAAQFTGEAMHDADCVRTGVCP